jgi:glutathione S-transferase
VKIYDSIGPNPKMVRMFAAEKDFKFSETETVDIMAGANREEPYLSKNPAGGMPAVELDGGQVVAETIAICELIEEEKPSPALIGSSAAERAEARMWLRRVEWKIIQPMTDAFRNGPGIQLFASRFRTDASVSPFFASVAQDGYEWLDKQLAGRTTIVPGRFSIADVALYSIAEFGVSVGQGIDPALKNVSAWFDAVKERPSAQA